jgi:hypothetical protein
MNIVKSLLGSLFLFLERIKGTKTVLEIKNPKNALGHLAAYHVSGFEINIYCQLKHYHRAYDRWYAPNTDIWAYHIFSVVSKDAPESIRQACELDIDLPSQFPSFVDVEHQKDEAIRAYLDLLISRFGDEFQSNKQTQ